MDTMKIIYKILERLEKAMDEERFDWKEISPEKFEISEVKWSRIIEMMTDKKLIAGLAIYRGAHGDISVSTNDPRITFDGLEYLADNTTQAKLFRAAKEIKDFIPGL